MGTNFYWHEKPPCPTCGHANEGKHIGKSSAGWVFALHVYPEDGINRLDDWIARFYLQDTTIKDEYGDTITPENMVARIAGRTPGLIRSNTDHHCLGPGPGSWDHFVGEFS